MKRRPNLNEVMQEYFADGTIKHEVTDMLVG